MTRNPVIDGWRGVSVMLVIVGHLIGYRLVDFWPVAYLDSFGAPFGTKSLAIVSSLGELGVSFFFTISGFLITSLLVVEEKKRGAVSLKAFYVRRVFRIMPAFYLYVATIFALGQAGLVSVGNSAILRSSAYVCDFSGFRCTWWLAHTWSLAVEEQFYILWPMLFLLRQRVPIALAIFVALLAGTAFVHELASFCFIMLGVTVALEPRLRDALAKTPERAIWVALAVLVLMPVFRPVAALVWAKPFLVAAVFFGTLLNTREILLRRLLQIPALAKVGLVSYSLYLWQQLSLSPIEWGGGTTGAPHYLDPLLAVAFIPIALASYRWIEKPMVKLGHARSISIQDASPIPPLTRTDVNPNYHENARPDSY